MPGQEHQDSDETKWCRCKVDGEPARLVPSRIEISFKNQVDMLENSGS